MIDWKQKLNDDEPVWVVGGRRVTHSTGLWKVTKIGRKFVTLTSVENRGWATNQVHQFHLTNGVGNQPSNDFVNGIGLRAYESKEAYEEEEAREDRWDAVRKWCMKYRSDSLSGRVPQELADEIYAVLVKHGELA